MSLSTPAATASHAGIPCRPWEGRPHEYQSEAKAVLEDRLDRGLPWIYVVQTCGTPYCLTDAHLRHHVARRIAYPAAVCVYCGMPGYTKDHLLPVTVTGEAARQFVAVVPACGECNNAIGDRVGHRITERREEAHRYLRRKYRSLLDGKLWTERELRQLGPNLRKHVLAGLAKREVIQQRLNWPHDPAYDRRAFERSGFDDPIGMELL